MWIKVFALVAVTTITGGARISGLQGDLGTGYSYNRPEESDAFTSVQSSVAYYINIPASERPADYFYVSSNPGGGVGYYASQSQDLTTPSGFGGGTGYSREIPDDKGLRAAFRASPSTSGLNLHSSFGESYSREIPEVAHSGFRAPYSPASSSSGFSPFVPPPDLPRHSDYTPFTPSYSQSTYGAPPRPQFISPPLRYQHLDPRNRPLHNPLPLPATNFQYQTPGFRSTQQQIFADVQPRHASEHQQLSVPSQQLMPPPYSPHVSLQVAPKSAPQQYRVVQPMASLPMSLNVKLPFPIGVVPIKFRPLPLKTHLRQAGLLPITSYQARESYRK